MFRVYVVRTYGLFTLSYNQLPEILARIFFRVSGPWSANEEFIRDERDWMLLLLGLNGEATERMVEAVKGFLERMWRIRGNV